MAWPLFAKLLEIDHQQRDERAEARDIRRIVDGDFELDVLDAAHEHLVQLIDVNDIVKWQELHCGTTQMNPLFHQFR